jgi:hypothetical protein
MIDDEIFLPELPMNKGDEEYIKDKDLKTLLESLPDYRQLEKAK